ncbi:hypothetical protein [Flavobacterium subsaxonicum]|uniref:KTSC domain-containing protein n=1 Tax=Flavobacterium subsaxonicum WB 4.1-42 = DSM 21790 TaxID=1121898 RepID=A0A0A2MPQ0_9FLAO|nr:hypothetical protein [Flavobacterium subsaxonicum]KGO94299.1 hypothetical protein Q766_05100 [Flavobacterium subsaxonicum WB 4.1-42 = DSM 21790]
MKRYKNLEGHSGVTGYEIEPDSIAVQFNHSAVYRYTYNSAGKRIIEKMKQLATAGKGLSTYISQTVKQKFEDKLT